MKLYLYSGPEPSAEEMLEAAQMRIAQLEAALEQKAPFTWLHDETRQYC